MILEILIYVFVAIFGLCIGSFLNCVIYRMEQKKSLGGRSFCPHCKHALSWLDLFPVFSFIFLGGKCRFCKEKISWQYPLVEITTAILFVLIFNKLGVIPNLIGNPDFVKSGLTWIPAFAGMTRGGVGMMIYSAFWFYIASSLIIIFVYDLKHYLIPDKVLFPAIIITFLYRLVGIFWIPAFAGMTEKYTGMTRGGVEMTGFLGNYIFAAILGGGFFLLIFLISKGAAMGFGDVKLAVLMGLLLGLPKVLVALFLAFFFGAIIGVILMAFKKKGLKSEIPFGPFLIAGTFTALFWGEQLITYYMHLFQI